MPDKTTFLMPLALSVLVIKATLQCERLLLPNQNILGMLTKGVARKIEFKDI